MHFIARGRVFGAYSRWSGEADRTLLAPFPAFFLGLDVSEHRKAVAPVTLRTDIMTLVINSFWSAYEVIDVLNLRIYYLKRKDQDALQV